MTFDDIEEMIRKYISTGVAVVIFLVSPGAGGDTPKPADPNAVVVPDQGDAGAADTGSPPTSEPADPPTESGETGGGAESGESSTEKPDESADKPGGDNGSGEDTGGGGDSGAAGDAPQPGADVSSEAGSDEGGGESPAPGDASADSSGGDSSGGDSSGGDSSGGGESSGDSSGGDKSGGDGSGSDSSGGDSSGDAKSGGDSSGGDKSGGDSSGSDSSGDDKSGGDKSGGDKSGGDKSGGDSASASSESSSSEPGSSSDSATVDPAAAAPANPAPVPAPAPAPAGNAAPGTAPPAGAGPANTAPTGAGLNSTSAAPAATVVTAAETHGWGAPKRQDDFSGGLDQWSLYSGPGHDGKGQRVPSAVAVKDGILTITGDQSGTSGGLALTPGQKYGRWEARVRAPAADPSYNAVMLLWPDADNFPVGGEIDFMEMTDPTRQTTDMFIHHGANNQQVNGKVKIDATQWHTWAVEWTPEAIMGYVDGKEWFRNTDSATFPPGPMHLCIQLDWFPNGAGSPKASTMEVDWVRQYSLDGAAPAKPADNTLAKPATAAERGKSDAKPFQGAVRRMFSGR